MLPSSWSYHKAPAVIGPAGAVEDIVTFAPAGPTICPTFFQFGEPSQIYRSSAMMYASPEDPVDGNSVSSFSVPRIFSPAPVAPVSP